MRHERATTFLMFDWANPIDEDLVAGAELIFAIDNKLQVTPYDRVLIAGISLPQPSNCIIDPKRPFWLLACKVLTADSSQLNIRLLRIYEKLLLRELDPTGSEALQRSAINDSEIQEVQGPVRILIPQPIGESRADAIRRKILGAAGREREFGAARRKASGNWRLGQSPAKKS